MAEQQEELTAEVFNDWSETARASNMAKSHDELLDPMFGTWDLNDQSYVLDIGCGVGAALLRASNAAAGNVAGLDLSKGMIETAIQNLPKGSDLQVGSVLNLPWDNNVFSHVLSVEALYYITDPLEAIREINRVSSNGATFSMVIEFYKESVGTHYWADNLPMQLTNWSEQEWCDAFTDAGFEDVQASRVIREEKPDPSTFEVSSYFPSYELYKDYLEQGALWVRGSKH